MYRITDDPRSIETSKMLYEGLAKLMRERDFDTITVTDLVRTAKVGRATFYRNFDTIEDVLRLRCDQVCEGLVAHNIELLHQNGGKIPLPRLKIMLRYFDQHSDIINLLIQANELDILGNALRRVLEPYWAAIGIDGDYLGYGLTIRIGVVTSILVHWVRTGKQQPPDELADKLSTIMRKIVMSDQIL